MTPQEALDLSRQNTVNLLIESMEMHPEKWRSGWVNVPTVGYNAVTKKTYHGSNAFILAIRSLTNGYRDPRWLTVKQANELGAHVNKGEKGTPIYYTRLYDKATKKDFDESVLDGMNEEEAKAYVEKNVKRAMRYYVVFNAAQCTNVPESTKIAVKEMSAEDRNKINDQCKRIIANSEAPISYDGGNSAYYNVSGDTIHLPEIKYFESMQDYYATALHEIAHSTGHPSRLDRKLGKQTGKKDYAVEELRAEIASVLLQVETGINLGDAQINNHAAYLDFWLKGLKEDKDIFFQAAKDATKITDYIKKNYLDKENSRMGAMVSGFKPLTATVNAPCDVDVDSD